MADITRKLLNFEVKRTRIITTKEISTTNVMATTQGEAIKQIEARIENESNRISFDGYGSIYSTEGCVKQTYPAMNPILSIEESYEVNQVE